MFVGFNRGVKILLLHALMPHTGTSMKFVILCPEEVRTGGPEACFQLCDSLIRNGFEAEIWLLNFNEFEHLRILKNEGFDFSKNEINFGLKNTSFEEYKTYKFNPFVNLQIGQQVCFIIPEYFVYLIQLFRNTKAIVWWLSVDNAFKALSEININLLRSPNKFHAVQSNYAQKFTEALGLTPFKLTDYTLVDNLSNDLLTKLSNRPLKISINAGSKVIIDLDHLTKLIHDLCADIQVVRIVGMSRQEVYNHFDSSRVFIDLGNLPGRDRMAREALVRGSNVILSSSGSGFYEEDYAIPSIYRPSPFDLPKICRLAVHMSLNPDQHYDQFSLAREKIKNEKYLFDSEVLQGFSQFF